MAQFTETENETLRMFRRCKIMTLADLIDALQCSRSTAQRRLKQWQCHTSYNLNGAYYALPEVVSFDEYGIWRFKEARFGLVRNSEAGLDAAELSSMMGVQAHSFIWNFANKSRLARNKIGGRYVYFSVDEQLCRKQQSRRLESTEGKTLTDNDAIVMLVELLKYPTLSPMQLSSRVHARAPSALPEAIETFLDKHGLSAGKKRAPDSL